MNGGAASGWYWPTEVTGSAHTYWTSKFIDDDTNYVRTVDFSTGAVEYHSLTNPCYARCMRAGP